MERAQHLGAAFQDPLGVALAEPGADADQQGVHSILNWRDLRRQVLRVQPGAEVDRVNRRDLLHQVRDHLRAQPDAAELPLDVG